MKKIGAPPLGLAKYIYYLVHNRYIRYGTFQQLLNLASDVILNAGGTGSLYDAKLWSRDHEEVLISLFYCHVQWL